MDYQVEFLHYYFRHSGAAQHRHFSRVDAFASRVVLHWSLRRGRVRS